MNKIKFGKVWILLTILCISSLFVFANDGAKRFRDWKTIGPSGGDVRVITIDPKNHDRIFISTLDGQIYKSEDAGTSWDLVENFERPQLILDQLMLDSRDSNIIYTSGHRHKLPGGFFKSVDGGKTWKEAKELKNESIHSMTQSPKDPNILTVGTLGGVWISNNSGDTWEKIKSDSMPVNIDSLAMDPRNTKTIYAGTWYRPFKSTDGGNSWHLINKGMIDDSDVFAITVNNKNPDYLVASACSGIYESYNAGESWAKIQGIPSQARRTRDILQHPSRPGTIYAATTEGFWMSTNSGKSWAMTTQRDLEINSIAVHPDNPDKVYIGTNNYGVMVSNDGGKNFTQTNGNFSSRFTYSITSDVEIPTRLYATTINTATGGGFIFISDDSGATWRPSIKNFDTNRTITYSLVQDKITPNNIYLATNFGIFQSTDRGVSWKQITVPKPPAAKKPVRRGKGKAVAAKPAPTPTPDPNVQALIPAIGDKINTLVRTEDGKNGYLAGTNNGLYRSYDIAKGWEKVSFGENINYEVLTILADAYQPETLWIGTSTNGVMVSKDNGATWSKISIIPDLIPVSAIVRNPKKPDYIYIGTKQTFYLSKDGGKSWSRRGGNLPLGNYASILVNPNNGNDVYVASALEVSDGIFYSDDAGWDWKRIDAKDTHLASRRVWAMIFDPNNANRLLIGTHSSGIYRLDQIPLMVSNEQTEKSNEALTRPRVSSTSNQ